MLLYLKQHLFDLILDELQLLVHTVYPRVYIHCSPMMALPRSPQNHRGRDMVARHPPSRGGCARASGRVSRWRGVLAGGG